ncbi:unnamed protein product [Acanthoscelides obtectus]|uniref:HAT C-terminal dimerisation domain-containing protein n=1 Tax=Acanthoscelides obtectus TaxID=200917 RepID=A0A9P0NU94_ACAOB|nr:unnamed protein product [Acanthoscelides obtectus]CAK1639766.1 Zinc finger MYM-type protein 6 [Acanthoscelides obtectus]
MNQEIYEELLFARTLITNTKEFLDTKDKILKENLMKRKTEIAYLTDLFTKFNMVNLQLQGDSLNLIKTKSILSEFLDRVKLMMQNIGRGEFSQFPNLSQTSCQEDDVSTYVQHLNALYSDFESRFEDILTMVIPPLIINPLGDIEETNVIIQEELTELSTNEELKVQFKNGYQQFWLQNNKPVTYPVLWNIARKFLISFPSSYLVERGFSAVTNLLTKERNRLDIISRGDLRLTLTKLTPNVDNLLLKHQTKPRGLSPVLWVIVRPRRTSVVVVSIHLRVMEAIIRLLRVRRQRVMLMVVVLLMWRVMEVLSPTEKHHSEAISIETRDFNIAKRKAEKAKTTRYLICKWKYISKEND